MFHGRSDSSNKDVDSAIEKLNTENDGIEEPVDDNKGKQKVEEEVLELDLGEYGSKLNKLEDAVCNHGLFMMPPNNWNPLTKTLQRPLRLSDSTNSVMVSISHHNHNSLHVRIQPLPHRPISFSDRQVILDQVRRMLRLSSKDENDVIEFQKLHPEANMKGFGRLFRSPTLFEDIVKSLLLCCCGFGRTLEMAKNLCKLHTKLTNVAPPHAPPTPSAKDLNHLGKRGLKRKYATVDNNNNYNNARRNLQIQIQNSTEDEKIGNFPSAKEVASMNENALNTLCNLGFRAAFIIKFAKKVENGQIKLEKLEEETSWKKVYDNLMKIEGFGPFVCANILMCLGFYNKVPCDTETKRHLRQIHGIENKKKKEQLVVVEQIYAKYAPFQCLGYWFELVEYYESKFGKLDELAKSSYDKVTGFLDDKYNRDDN